MFLNLDSAQNAAGIYGVNLYALGVPHTIIVDDYVPVTTIWDAKDKKNVETTVFNRISRDGALWMTILEKAFAKFHGNYKHIEAGDIRKSANTIHGTPYELVKNSEKTVDEIWEQLKNADENGDIIQCGTEGDDDTMTQDNGLVMGHAYTVLSVV